MSERRHLGKVLVVQPEVILRRSTAATVAMLGIAAITEADTAQAAGPLLAAQCFDGLVLDVDEGAAAFALLERLRAGAFATTPDVRLLLTCSAGVELAAAAAAGPRARLLRKPVRVKDMLLALDRMAQGRRGAPAGPA